ncbi:polymer-forming cytoskeletal protein (plasmid) [Pedobacter sp. BS3]|uniref:bactofilin family protein n=1 Tax=Pedobacter sp. BS3 TaxID=2567937 RepID=UPI0011EC6135|nr:polymer-forming cytoskeletal protein [Pedobacter sp. BS3]TZF86230.1 polymer-forming cytoskeletal protein [Pedobacter sp. BS3]
MFQKSRKMNLDEQKITSLISEGCVLDGQLKAPGFIRIDGTVHGNVTVEQGLILGEKASVNGDVVTKDMIVYGTVNGNISAQILEIKQTGKVNGDISTRQLQVELGAVYNGKLNMSYKNTPELLPKATEKDAALV